MMILITYDVNTETPEGRRRLRQLSKMCLNYGQRVQNSVYECLLDVTQYAAMREKLSCMIDPEEDSLRFYQIGNHYENKIIHVGKVQPYNQCDILII